MTEEFIPYGPQNKEGCIFCSGEIKSRIVVQHGSVFAVVDKFPVTQGHMLIIPFRHTEDYFSMISQEKCDAEELLKILRNKALDGDKTITGFNVGMNCGADAGQTVMHAHIHLIPRRRGDVENPRGGVRHLIPGKGSY